MCGGGGGDNEKGIFGKERKKKRLNKEAAAEAELAAARLKANRSGFTNPDGTLRAPVDGAGDFKFRKVGDAGLNKTRGNLGLLDEEDDEEANKTLLSR